MKRLACALILVLLAGGTWRAVDNFRTTHPVSGIDITVPGHNGVNALLVSGWRTTPAGRQLPSGDMILSGQVSPDGTLFAFTNTGYTRHGLHIVDLATEKEIATFPLEQAWSGLAFSPDSKRIYVSSGVGYAVSDVQYFDRWDNGGWQDARAGYTLVGALKTATAVSSITLSADGKLLYALNNSDDHLYILDTYGGRAVARLNVGDHPLSAKLSKDGKTLYVANLGSASVSVVDVSEPERPQLTATLATDPHPNDLALTSDGRLFVACGHTNNVISFDLKTHERLEVISTALGPKAPAGSTPNSLALSPDGKRLYVANADNNSVAVIAVEQRGHSTVLGFLPTGWYPTFVTTSPDGNRIIVASGKGTATGPNRVKRPIDPTAPSLSFQHHGNQLTGLVSFVEAPDAERLAEYTKQVYENALYRDALLELLLGLPPMTQHDTAAPPMVNSFMARPDMSGFTALPATVDLMTRNPRQGYGATVSARMDFSDYDRVDEDTLNRILWHSIKGAHVPYPAPTRRALPTPYGLFTFPAGGDVDDRDQETGSMRSIAPSSSSVSR
jgi:YVTN family beta-propeller protein